MTKYNTMYNWISPFAVPVIPEPPPEIPPPDKPNGAAGKPPASAKDAFSPNDTGDKKNNDAAVEATGVEWPKKATGKGERESIMTL